MGASAGAEAATILSQACLTLARASRDTVMFAFDQAGATAIRSDQPLQRCLRDILTGLKHASFSSSFLARIGRTRLGLPSADGPL